MAGECSAAGCFLARNGSLVSLPLVSVAGIVDGLNPCAIGMLLLLLGYLIVFAKKPEKVLAIGGLYIVTVFLTYLTLGLAFYKGIGLIQQSEWFGWVNRILGGVLLVVGLIQVKNFFAPEVGPTLKIPFRARDRLMGLIEKSTAKTTVALAVVVTILETPCSLPLYVGTAAVLSQSGLPSLVVALYFVYYNLLFVLPLVVLLLMVWKGKQVTELSEWKHKAEKWMQLLLGVVVIGVGLWLIK